MSKMAFIYPGQGAQKAGMGKDFYAYSHLASDIYDRASEIFRYRYESFMLSGK